MFDILVIGKGLIGSAAARYLSETAHSVAIIGPDEPQDWATHQGVFASHYDQGRITRVLDPDLVWARLAQRSIAQYLAIEQRSGIRFYHQTGGLQVGKASNDRFSKLKGVGDATGVAYRTYNSDELRESFAFFHFAEGIKGIHEPTGAGYINPRSLVAAQLHIAEQQGATIMTDTVVSVSRGTAYVTIRTAQGHTYQAGKVLIAAGGYSNQLLARPLDMTVLARTILLAEVPASEVTRLQQMPTVIWWGEMYLLPPVPYPDGKVYIKIGGDGPFSKPLSSAQEMLDWFHSDGSPETAARLKSILLSVLPQLQVTSFHTKPCVTTYPAKEYPLVDVVEAEQLFIAAGGCGASAKSSNEIGRLAAQMVLHGKSPSDW